MDIKDVLYFSPKYKFKDLKWNDKKELIKAFVDRIKGFYLYPISKLNREKNAFAAGLLCVSVIDILAKYQTGCSEVKRRYTKWLEDNIEEFKERDHRNEKISLRFYKEFRNGLIHEGRIKEGGVFSYYVKNIHVEKINEEASILMVNPCFLEDSIRKAFDRYIEIISRNDYYFQMLKSVLLNDFLLDIERSKNL